MSQWRLAACWASLILLPACSAIAPHSSSSGFPPLPGPDPQAEAVAVSQEIATPDHPVFYYRDPQDRDALIAYDWSGVVRGRVGVSASGPFGVYPSADGTVMLLTGAQVLSGGRKLGKVSVGTWAGDDRQLCVFLNELGGDGSPRVRQVSANEQQGLSTDGWLFLESATGAKTRLVRYGAFGDHGGPQVLACNATANRAVIAETFVGQQSQIELVRLSDGHVITGFSKHPTLMPGGQNYGPDGIVVSTDGSLVAEGSTANTWNGHNNDSFVVRNVSDGRVVATVGGGGAVAFSGDNTRVLTVQYLNGGNQSGRYQVVDLASSRVLWSAVMAPGTHLTRTGSSDFVVASRNAYPMEDVWLIPAQGAARLLLTRAAPIG